MKALYRLLDSLRLMVRKIMRRLAGRLQSISRGRVSPDNVTIVGLIGHLPIAYLIARGHLLPAAGLLVFFGLFDTLDGELARLQHQASNAGMLLDATTDRFKEVLLYSGAAYFFIASRQPGYAVWAVIACGASLCVSYVKAKGETAVKDSALTANQINRLFQDGLLRFEVRMFLLFFGLLINRLDWAIIIIALLSAMTAVGRLIKIRRWLRHV